MLTAQENQTLIKKLELYEGRVSHMYCDTDGNVTVGVGHLLSSAHDAQKFKWHRQDKGISISNKDIEDDFNNVKKNFDSTLKSSNYKQYTKLFLDDMTINKSRDDYIRHSAVELKSIYHNFDKYPTEVRLVLFDMIFNLGMPNLRWHWPHFNAAIKAEDWEKAATECSRTGIQQERNDYVENLLEKAAANKKAAAGK